MRSRDEGPGRAVLRAVAVALWGLLGLLAARHSRDPLVLGRYSHEYATLLVVVLLVAAAATVLQSAGGVVRLRGARHALVLLACSSALSLFMMEALVRRLDLFGASMYQEVTRYQLTLVPDAALIVRQRPGLRGVYAGVEIAINEQGLRERPLAAKSPQRPRILVLGDSVAFGWGVRVETAFPRRLEHELQSRFARDVETVNAGVPGYNTVLELAFLRRQGPVIEPDAVVLVYVDNDIEVAEPLPLDFGRTPSLWGDPLGLGEHLLRKLWLYRLGYHLTPLLLPLRKDVEPGPAVGWRASMESLAETAAWCRARGIPFVAFLYRPTAAPLTDALAKGIADLAARDGFVFVDVLPWFAGLHVREMTLSFVDVHPNARAHQVLSRGMAQALIASGSIRPAVQAGRGVPGSTGPATTVSAP